MAGAFLLAGLAQNSEAFWAGQTLSVAATTKCLKQSKWAVATGKYPGWKAEAPPPPVKKSHIHLEWAHFGGCWGGWWPGKYPVRHALTAFTA